MVDRLGKGFRGDFILYGVRNLCPNRTRVQTSLATGSTTLAEWLNQTGSLLY